jgi:hypothetical protein
MEKKICSKCKIEKDVCEFGKKNTNKDGLQSRCKECRKIESKEFKEKYPNKNKEAWLKNKEKHIIRYKEWYSNNPNYNKEWRLKNKERVNENRRNQYLINLEKNRETARNFREKNKEIIRQKSKIYREENREKLNEAKRARRKENLEKFRLMEREKFINNPHLKLIRNYRTRIKNYMRFNKISEGTGTMELVGLTSEGLKEYLESKFVDGMSWDNYGLYGWHIDHIIPLSSAKNNDELRKLCHYTNLQPLWSFDNLSKGDKYN